jgi:hypothetical protein
MTTVKSKPAPWTILRPMAVCRFRLSAFGREAQRLYPVRIKRSAAPLITPKPPSLTSFKYDASEEKACGSS